MRIGIDGSNISSGGGVTHLSEILNALDLSEFGIQEIEVWSIQGTLSKILERDGITLKNDPVIESNLINRLYWQQKKLSDIASERYDILYVPGGSYLGSFQPFVTMNRNLQPFDIETRRRYNLSFQKMRLSLLEKVQAKTYRNAAGVIFLSREAKELTTKKIGNRIENTEIVPHGIANKFFKEPGKIQSNDSYSFDKPFEFLYASRINVYKHQWNVIEAIKKLREEGYPIVLKLVGNIENKQSEKLFSVARKRFDPKNEFVMHYGRTTQEELLKFYHSADAFVFASSCETFGQVLLEAMASALPIACAERSAMPEILKDNGVYFNPEDPISIAASLRKLMESKALREELSILAYKEARTYSWKRCAEQTFGFIKEVYLANIKQ